MEVKNLRRIECITAILNVSNMESSLDFYINILGFQNAAWGNEYFTSVSRNNTGIYLCANGQGQPGTWIWVGIDGDIFALYEELLSKGIIIKMPPQNFSWAMEMHVFDPDGHVLRFGTDPDESMPFADR
ncbi:MAG TPA: VOC family protein [Puia sp.]|nr:VOC family protein [Puia sp.]